MFGALSAASETVNPAVINTVGAAVTLGGLLLTAGWLVYLFRGE